MLKSKNDILKEEESFHDDWAKEIDLTELCILEAFEGPVSPEYHYAINLLDNLNGKTILNPGCGAGEETIYLAKKGAKVIAIDISEGMLRIGTSLARKFHLDKNITFQKMNAEKLDFKNESFDYIFGNSILHHVDIEEGVDEFYRVLKKGGKAVFIEPLFYNPLINYYRRLARLVRTTYEHPLKFSDIDIFKKHFKTVNHYEFQFLTLLIFCYFFLVQRVNPNKDRYWKKIIREGRAYEKIFNILFALDKKLLGLFPFLRRYCWVTIIEAQKQ